MSNNQPSVTLICDSINDEDVRISTFELKYWRPLLAEVNTHRVFSRNASSSRAQSFEKRLEQVRDNPFMPSHWNAEKKGMQGGEEFSPEIKTLIDNMFASLARDVATRLYGINCEVRRRTGHEIHKQYLNRYLEPFTAVTQLVTATSWDNFFNLRISEEAQPEIKDVASQMQSLLRNSYPYPRKLHIPYVTYEDLIQYDLKTCLDMSVARCARVCYGITDPASIERDKALAKTLFENGHMSPFEHIAYGCGKGDASFYNMNSWMNYRYALDNHCESLFHI